nr:unnamed protein product [Callosobruchus analis]
MEVHKKRTNIHSDSTSFIASGNLKAHPPKRPETAAAYLRVCSHCNISFQSAQGLADHIVKKHPSSISTVTRKIHECTKCTYRTTISSTFKKHMAKHPDLAGMCVRISCSYCNKTFVHKKSLNDHIAKKHPDFIASVSSKVHECTECSFKTTKISNLREHMAKHPELGVFSKCTYCNKTFAYKISLNDHIIKKHPDFIATVSSKIHECAKCTYKTTISSKLTEHMIKHTDFASNCVLIKCTYCNKTFAHKKSLNDHITKKHPDFIASVSSKIHECTKCTYKTTRSSRFRDHMAKHPELGVICRCTCTYCNKTFAHKISLNDHIIKMHPDFIASVSSKIHECAKCTYKTTISSKLTEHMTKHPDLASNCVLIRCSYCNKTFAHKKSLNDHIIKIHPDFIASVSGKIHECTKCAYKTTRSSHFRDHMAKHPELAAICRCTYCDETFPRKTLLNEHITKKHPDFIASVGCKVHECTKCSYKTTRSSHLKDHMAKHPELADNCVFYRCTYCNKTFVRKTLLNEHITKKHPDFIASVSCKVHECTKCSFKTTRIRNFKEHMVVHHELAGSRIFKCTYCNKTFARKLSLNDHIIKKHPDFIASVSSKIHECTKCTYKTTRSSHFRDHMATHPELAAICRCTYCDKTFPRKTLLNNHITKKHPDFIASVSCKVHECTKCTYKTTRSSYLKDHMAKHPELADNCVFCRCTYCNKTFASKTVLNEHITKKHPDFIASVSCKVHECTKCSFKTTRICNLKKHMVVHPELAGNRIFNRCIYCDETFASKLSLNDHITKKHPDFIASVSSKIHECTKCTYKTTRSSNFRDHMAKHHELAGNCVIIRCTYCNKTFAYKKSLDDHITKKHPDFIASVSSKVHECTKCTYKTTRSSHLKHHMAKHS